MGWSNGSVKDTSSETSTVDITLMGGACGQSHSVFREIYDSLSTNPYFGAGAGLAGIGLGMSILRRLAIVSNAFFRRRFIISLEINNEDAAYPWLLNYINRHSVRQTRHLSVHTAVRQAESGRTLTTFSYLPSHGMHYFLHNYRWIQVERQREKQTIQRNGYRTPFETVTLTTVGVDVQFLKNILDRATAEALAEVETGLVVYQAVGPDWRRFGAPRRKRPLASVVLDDRLSDEIHDDFSEFCSSAQWYAERGVPYRRGYLFYGPPGSGKSSFIAALASHFGYSICMLSLSERTLDDDRLNHLLNTPPPNSIVLLEDVDAAFNSRADAVQKQKAYEGLTRVTFSGLLNAIDGVACAEERILFMTTNHVERLDPALIRPGRVDVKKYFGYCKGSMLAKMFIRFYGNRVSDEVAYKFQTSATALGADLSPAQIQGHLLLHKEDPQAAIKNVSMLTAAT
uniref:Mitochondrial chaperone BCS1 n=2 Tax=Parascaris univalens TaxID=6257 RepID=A0A915AYD2_PARUN